MFFPAAFFPQALPARSGQSFAKPPSGSKNPESANSPGVGAAASDPASIGVELLKGALTTWSVSAAAMAYAANSYFAQLSARLAYERAAEAMVAACRAMPYGSPMGAPAGHIPGPFSWPAALFPWPWPGNAAQPPAPFGLPANAALFSPPMFNPWDPFGHAASFWAGFSLGSSMPRLPATPAAKPSSFPFPFGPSYL
jgi:hypothetical protein